MQSVTSNAVAKLSERVDTSNWTITYETSNVTNCTVTCTRIGKGIAIVEIVIFSSGSNNSQVISLVTVDTHGKVGNIISHLGYTVCCGDQFEIVPKIIGNIKDINNNLHANIILAIFYIP